MPTNTALGCVHCPPTRMLSASTMTAERQEKNSTVSVKFFSPRIGSNASLARLISLAQINAIWVSSGGLPCLPFAALATTTERVVVNRFTGLAIEGFDPVAYFTDARPELGLADFE